MLGSFSLGKLVVIYFAVWDSEGKTVGGPAFPSTTILSLFNCVLVTDFFIHLSNNILEAQTLPWTRLPSSLVQSNLPTFWDICPTPG